MQYLVDSPGTSSHFTPEYSADRLPPDLYLETQQKILTLLRKHRGSLWETEKTRYAEPFNWQELSEFLEYAYSYIYRFAGSGGKTPKPMTADVRGRIAAKVGLSLEAFDRFFCTVARSRETTTHNYFRLVSEFKKIDNPEVLLKLANNANEQALSLLKHNNMNYQEFRPDMTLPELCERAIRTHNWSEEQLRANYESLFSTLYDPSDPQGTLTWTDFCRVRRGARGLKAEGEVTFVNALFGGKPDSIEQWTQVAERHPDWQSELEQS